MLSGFNCVYYSWLSPPPPSGVDLAHQSLLVETAQRCWQYLNWECRGAVITKKTWWVGRDGHKATYWAGGDPVKGGCFCNLFDECRGGKNTHASSQHQQILEKCKSQHPSP